MFNTDKELAYCTWLGIHRSDFWKWLGHWSAHLGLDAFTSMDDAEEALKAACDALRLLVQEEPEGDWRVYVRAGSLEMRRVHYDERWLFCRIWCVMQARLTLGIYTPDTEPHLFATGMLPQEWVTLEASLELVRRLSGEQQLTINN